MTGDVFRPGRFVDKVVVVPAAIAGWGTACSPILAILPLARVVCFTGFRERRALGDGPASYGAFRI